MARNGQAEEDLGELAFLAHQGVSREIVSAIVAYRASHPAPAEEISRVPRPQTHFVGARTWEIAAAALLAGCNLLLSGPKATGKNVLARDLAFVFGRPEWDISFHIDMDAASMLGTDTYADGRVSFRPGPIARCAQAGGLGVLDEINMARSEALAVLHATLDFRRVIDVPGYDLINLDEATRFVGTMNVGYVGTRELNEALASRFVVVAMEPLDRDGLRDLLAQEAPDLTHKAIEQFATLFDEIRAKCKAGELSEKALDLRGLLDAVRLMRVGLDPISALDACVANKTFDDYERSLVRDAIRARVPRSLKGESVFE